MTEPPANRLSSYPSRTGTPSGYGQSSGASLADILERVLDKGIVIAGDIRINLLDIELLTIKLRLIVASVDKAKEMGIDWWEHDPSLSSHADDRVLADENRRLRAELEAMREERELSADHGRSAVREEGELSADHGRSAVREEGELSADHGRSAVREEGELSADHGRSAVREEGELSADHGRSAVREEEEPPADRERSAVRRRRTERSSRARSRKDRDDG